MAPSGPLFFFLSCFWQEVTYCPEGFDAPISCTIQAAGNFGSEITRRTGEDSASHSNHPDPGSDFLAVLAKTMRADEEHRVRRHNLSTQVRGHLDQIKSPSPSSFPPGHGGPLSWASSPRELLELTRRTTAWTLRSKMHALLRFSKTDTT